jgi:hypothetical protein
MGRDNRKIIDSLLTLNDIEAPPELKLKLRNYFNYQLWNDNAAKFIPAAADTSHHLAGGTKVKKMSSKIVKNMTQLKLLTAQLLNYLIEKPPKSCFVVGLISAIIIGGIITLFL